MKQLSNVPKKRTILRYVIRCCALAAAVVLLSGVLPWSSAPLVVPSLSTYVLICGPIATRTVGLAALVGLPVLLIVLVRRRWFCRYLCPVGLMAEQVSRLRPLGKSKARLIPPLGRWIVLITLGGACLGYPLFLWMDPLAIFSGLFSPGWAGGVSAAVVGVVLLISLLLPGGWCLRICPLGATQELLALPRRLFKQQKRQGIHADENQQPVCTQARDVEIPIAEDGKLPILTRRSVISTIAGAACIGLGAKWAAAMTGYRRQRPLRPPGAVDEGRFSGLCIRCGNCIRACPARIIRADQKSLGIAGFLTPVLDFKEDYCREDCNQCTTVCPSGAITRLPLDEKQHAPIGVAKIDTSICLLAEDRECDQCARICPYQAVQIVWSQEEYISLPVIDPQKCPGCGACAMICPGTNEWERETSEEPIPVRRAIEVRAPGL